MKGQRKVIVSEESSALLEQLLTNIVIVFLLKVAIYWG